MDTSSFRKKVHGRQSSYCCYCSTYHCKLLKELDTILPLLICQLCFAPGHKRYATVLISFIHSLILKTPLYYDGTKSHDPHDKIISQAEWLDSCTTFSLPIEFNNTCVFVLASSENIDINLVCTHLPVTSIP